MGLEAPCTLRVGRKRTTGKALLESTEIVFRGQTRLRIPFSEIRSVRAEAGALEIIHAGGKAVLEIGDQAQRWAEKITKSKSRLDKLGAKAGMRVAALAVEDSEFIDELRDRGVDLVTGAAAKSLDLAFLGARKTADLAKLKALRAQLEPNGAIWVVWPKGRPELKEDHVRAAALAIGMVDVKVASFSATLSALKLVIPVAQRAGRLGDHGDSEITA